MTLLEKEKVLPLLLGVVLLQALCPGLAGAAGAISGKEPVARPAPPVLRAGSPVLGSLESMSNCAEDIYDLAKGNRIERLGGKLEALKKSAAVVRTIQDDDSRAMLLPRLDRTIADLDRAVAAHSRYETMLLANKVTLIAATLSVSLRPRVPAEVSLLEYNGRELEIWSELSKLEKLSAIVGKMHLTWQMLMPKLIDIGAIKEMRRFSDTMGSLEAAKSVEEYARLSRQVATAVNTMETLFLKGKVPDPPPEKQMPPHRSSRSMGGI